MNFPHIGDAIAFKMRPTRFSSAICLPEFRTILKVFHHFNGIPLNLCDEYFFAASILSIVKQLNLIFPIVSTIPIYISLNNWK